MKKTSERGRCAPEKPMNGKKQFFKNGILLTLVALSMRGVALFSSSFVSGAVGAEGMGLYTLVMTVYGFALTFATAGISLTVTNLVAAAIPKGDREVGSVLRAATLYAVAFGGAATAVLFFLAPFFGSVLLGDARTAVPIRILSLSLLPEAILSVFTGYFVGVRRVANNAVLQVAAQIFKLSLTVVFVGRAARGGVAAACTALALCATLTDAFVFLIALVQFLRARRGGARGVGGEALAPVCRMAFPLATSAYLRSALLTLEHVLIPKRLRLFGQSASASLASYGILHGMALPLVLYPMAPLSSFAGLLVPEFAQSSAEGNGARCERMCERALRTAFWYGIGVSSLLMLFSEELGYLFYHSAEAGQYIAMLAPVVPIMYLDHATDQILKGIGEQVASMWINITDSLLSVILVYLLLPVMGVSGYALMIIVMELYNFLLSFLRLRRRIRFRMASLVSLCVPPSAAAIAVLLCRRLFLMNGAVTPLLWMLLKLLFCLAVYVGATVLLSSVLGAALARLKSFALAKKAEIRQKT